MSLNPREIFMLFWLVLVSANTVPVIASETDSSKKENIEYSRDPGTLLISFREIFPEFADQDPTPLIRIFGDGRTVVFRPSYMKHAGQYEMLISRSELEDLLLQITPVLMDFNPKSVKAEKKASDDLLWASAADWKDVTLFYDSDATISVFQVNIDAYQPGGVNEQKISNPKLEKSWRGLQFDARDYTGIDSIQALMRAELSLRAITRRRELVRVE